MRELVWVLSPLFSLLLSCLLYSTGQSLDLQASTAVTGRLCGLRQGTLDGVMNKAWSECTCLLRITRM